MLSWANWRTVDRNSCSSSERTVKGEAGWEASAESVTKLKLSAGQGVCPATRQEAKEAAKALVREAAWEPSDGGGRELRDGRKLPDERWAAFPAREFCEP